MNFISRQIRLNANAQLGDQALSARLASLAIEERNQAISSGQASKSYLTYVDGILGAPEKNVKPNGTITYKFTYLAPAISMALSYLQTRSPVRSGKFKKSWLVVVDGNIWEQARALIPYHASVMILNPLPYSRKIEVGAMKKMSVPPQLILGARALIRSNFPNLNATRIFVNIPPSLIPNAPYILKKHHAHKKSLRAGQAITYPALLISQRQ